MVREFVRLLGENKAREIGLLFCDGNGKPAYVWPRQGLRMKGKILRPGEVFTIHVVAVPGKTALGSGASFTLNTDKTQAKD